MKLRVVSLAIWKWDGYVVIGGTPDEAKRCAKRLIGAEPSILPRSMGHGFVEYGRPWFLWCSSLKEWPTLAHEAVHIAGGVLENRGVKFASDNDEALAYTMEFILRECRRAAGWRPVVRGRE